MTTPDRDRFVRVIRKFKTKKVLVLGDLMLDRYIWGAVSRISPEAPVPVVEVQKDSLCLGGAGNVAQNLHSLGATPLLTGVVGNDPEGRWIRDNAAGSQGIFVDRSRPTTVKTRIIAHHQQVVRVDLEKKGTLSAGMEKKILDHLRLEEYDGLLISDYNKGIVNPSLMAKTLSLAEERRIPVFVDPKVPHFLLFSPVTLITPNHFEAEKIVGHDCRTEAEVEKAGAEILSLISSRYLIIKRGEEGMAVFEQDRKPIHIPTVAREVFDVTGAGDTVIGAAGLALLCGATIREAALIANAAAGIVVGKIGTATATPRELLSALAAD
ncbi:MAG TPA: D-glycero-beta-D-manno-heptose-7-phosphate kinase [Candidatus Desulfaltia sp.]|nr:D-glycero-beta-D-manno-heptose-7-phosphate kinase [Candidatus Desulfaltia sp.]